MTLERLRGRQVTATGAVAFLAFAILLPCTSFARTANNADPFEIPAPPADEVLFFNSSNGFVVQISESGTTLAAIRRRDRPEYAQVFRLGADEMKELLRLVKSVQSAPFNPDAPSILHCPDERLRVALGGQRRITATACRIEFQPLSSFLYKIFNQTEHLWRIDRHEQIYDVYSALSPTSAGQRPLQPQVLRDPLKALISATTDFDRLNYAMSSLSYLMPPDEWSEYLSKEIEAAEEFKRVRLLKVLSSADFRPTGQPRHMEARAPIFLKQLQRDYSKWPAFAQEKADAFDGMVSVLCHQHYSPAVPILIKTLSDMPDYSGPPGVWGYQHMQDVIISPLEGLLEHPKPQTRSMAAHILGQITGINPALVKPEDQKRMLDRLRAGPAAKLKRLAATDSVPDVRDAAKRALGNIQAGWAR
jgi:hypothetical protein